MNPRLLAATLTSLTLSTMAPVGAAFAHGAAPQVKEIRWPAHAEGRVWLVDELGLLDERMDGFHWLCDDTVSTLVGFDSAHAVDETGDVWVVATRAGIFRTTDHGCSFTRVEGPLTEHVVVGLWGHPERPDEIVTTTQTLGIANDVWRSTDGGQTWNAAGIDAPGRVRSLVRSPAAPDTVYATHAGGASRSDDGGATFAPIALGPPVEAFPDGLDVRPEEFRLLTAHPSEADTVFALVERFPASFLTRSTDRGASWEIVFEIEDAPDSMAFDATGQGALLASPFAGLFRSEDGGATWQMVPSPGRMGCLTTAPDGSIWACGRGQPRPWVAASTADLGANWQPALAVYTDLLPEWGCPEGTPTAMECSERCQPGDAECLAGMIEGDAAVDLGVDDAGVDAMAQNDAGPSGPDAAPTGGEGGASDDGCRSVDGPSTAWWWVALLGLRRRVLTPRRSPRHH